MADPFVGEIKMFAGNFAPRGWALCDGQLLAVSSNDALFSLFGTIYGGDGRTTFGLPDLRGRIPIHHGSGPGLPPVNLAAKSGTEKESVTVQTLASHNHEYRALKAAGTNINPVGSFPAGSGSAATYRHDDSATTTMSAASIGNNATTGRDHNNVMPFQCLNFIVSLFGVYPSRN